MAGVCGILTNFWRRCADAGMRKRLMIWHSSPAAKHLPCTFLCDRKTTKGLIIADIFRCPPAPVSYTHLTLPTKA